MAHGTALRHPMAQPSITPRRSPPSPRSTVLHHPTAQPTITPQHSPPAPHGTPPGTPRHSLQHMVLLGREQWLPALAPLLGEERSAAPPWQHSWQRPRSTRRRGRRSRGERWLLAPARRAGAAQAAVAVGLWWGGCVVRRCRSTWAGQVRGGQPGPCPAPRCAALRCPPRRQHGHLTTSPAESLGWG